MHLRSEKVVDLIHGARFVFVILDDRLFMDLGESLLIDVHHISLLNAILSLKVEILDGVSQTIVMRELLILQKVFE